MRDPHRVPESRLSPAQASMSRELGPLEGAKIPGGCDHCNAYQVVKPIEAGVWSIGVYHDDWCPQYGTRKAEQT